MENQNTNQTNSTELSQLKSMFADYQKKQKQNKRKTSEEILAKYFVPRKTKETFRILPPKQGRKHIEEAFFHVVTTITAGGKKKHGTIIYCPAHNDPKVKKLDANGNVMHDGNGQPIMIPAPCPLCAEHKRLLSTQDPSLKGIKKENMNEYQLKIKEKNDKIYKDAIAWEAKKFYIIRGIDRGQEKDGVKFWRFKHNFKNQGTLDKILPILEEYTTTQQADFSSEVNGTDLTITMTDSEFNGRVYKSISAVTFRGKSPLHSDSIVARQWLDDDVTWRDVFLPKKAPNITPYEFLEMVIMGVNPYWDDSDQNNKRWVFPGHPELEAKANTRTQNLDAEKSDDIEQASDLNDEPRVSISNVNESNVGTFKDDSVNVGNSLIEEHDEKESDNIDPDIDENQSTGNDYDDLPF